MIAEMKNKRKIAGILVAIGLVFYIIDLVVYIPKFNAFAQATKTWNYTATHTFPNPAAYGLDNTAFIISPILAFISYTLILIGGGYLLAVIVAKILRQLGYLKQELEITKQNS
jgi:hypothetical protein